MIVLSLHQSPLWHHKEPAEFVALYFSPAS
jgi:hypothetical protein